MALRVEVDRAEVARIARSHGVWRLRVFGSATTDAFDATRSDVDLLVEFAADVADPFA